MYSMASDFQKEEERRRKISVGLQKAYLDGRRSKNIGMLGKKHSEETKRKMSEYRRAHPTPYHIPWNSGMKGQYKTGERSIETRENISKALKRAYAEGSFIHPNLGKKRPEVGKKVSASLKIGYATGKITPYMLGKHHTEETKKKLREATIGHLGYFKGRKHTEETRKKMSKNMTGVHHISFTNGGSFKKGSVPPNKGKKGWMMKEQIESVRRKLWRGGGLMSGRRAKYKRKSWGYNKINPDDDVEGYEGHHIDKNNVIFIPKKLHHSVYHSHSKPETMERINTKAFCWILGCETYAP